MARTVAVVIHADRHSDPQPFAFDDMAQAITFAAARLREFARYPDAVTEYTEFGERIGKKCGKVNLLTSDMTRGGWRYFATYSEEGDSITVHEVPLTKTGDEPA